MGNSMDNTSWKYDLQKPLVSGVLVGCILGDPVQGAIIGAAIQLPFIAYISAGGAPPTDPGLAGTLGTALAMAAGVKPEAAIAMAVPIGPFRNDYMGTPYDN